MSLSTIIKENKSTITNARNFFKHGGQYDRYLSIAMASTNISSIDLSKPSSPTNYSGALEQIYLKAINANKIVKSVKEAINLLPDDKAKAILKGSYFENKSMYLIESNIHVEHSYASQLKSYGLYLFADLFLIRQLANRVTSPIDLHGNSTN